MGKLCAPIRDNDIKQLKATDNIVELLRLVFRFLCGVFCGVFFVVCLGGFGCSFFSR